MVTLGDNNCFDYPTPLYGNNVTPLIMCHFNILQSWSSQQHRIIKIYHIILKFNKCNYVRNVMNIYLQISNQIQWFCGCLICHPQIIWCMFGFWKPQPRFQLFYDNINFRTSIQQHILCCILPNMYLDICHMIIYYYNNCPYLWY